MATQTPVPIETIAVVGCGNMGGAILVGFIKRQGIPAARVIACDASRERLEVIGKEIGCDTATDPRVAVKRADVVVLAVKPKDAPGVIASMAEGLSGRSAQPIVASVVGGLRVETLAAGLGKGARPVRVMPNIACMVGLGLSTLYAPDIADRERVEQLFRGVGDTVIVDREDDLDIATALCASAPAFIFQSIEALADGGVKMGLTREVSLTMAAKMVRGAAAMMVETGLHPAQLKDMVASPAGTTIAGLHVLEEAGVRGAYISAIEAAVNRARALRN